MDKLKMQSLDIVGDNIEKIAALFPNCITETKDENGKTTRGIDFDLLRQELSDEVVEGPEERYQLNWPGKRKALLNANEPINKTLRPAREESVDFDNTKNIFIEGDNLDALKLLQESYLGKVKMIYIDPPYNTGNDFIYEDDFSIDKQEYLQQSGQIDDAGNRLKLNPETNGRFHSDWLCMMYPRLKLARNLLRDDGVIFISIANNEFANLRRICDEIFGDRNFIECITWNKRIPKNDTGIGNIHDFIMLYAKDTINWTHEFRMRKDGLDDIFDLVKSLKQKRASIQEAEKEIKKLYNKNGYDRGITLYNSLDDDFRPWGKINMNWPSTETVGPKYEIRHPITGRVVKIPSRGWRWKKETFEQAANIKNGEYIDIKKLHDGTFRCGSIWFSSDEQTQPSSITYLENVSKFLLRSILSLKSEGGTEVEELFEDQSLFSRPKPTSLLRTLISSVELNRGDIILDFFAGSATTAHAVMQLNAEDGGNRQFILVQLPEKCDEKSEAFKAGYKNIAEISKERIRRAGQKIKDENPLTTMDLDIGFRVLKIDSSNLEDTFYTADETKQQDLLARVENIKQGRTDEDLLFQILIDWAIPLDQKIIRQNIGGKNCFIINQDPIDLLACFERDITEGAIKEMANLTPTKAIFRDGGFKTPDAKINARQLFKQLSPNTDVRYL